MNCKFFLLAFLFNISNIKSNFQFYSQDGQDKFVYETFFKNKKNPGIFVDIGAYDGVVYSNSYFFEKYLNWSGICVEPVPSFFEQLVSNRNCTCINGCISDQLGEKSFMIAGMLSGLIDKYDNRHLQRIDKETPIYNFEKRVIQAACYTFNDVMKNAGIDHIDYLSIDTEGGELDILKSIDFDAITIDIIDVENNYQDNEMRKFLAKKGYELVKCLGADEIFKRKDFQPY